MSRLELSGICYESKFEVSLKLISKVEMKVYLINRVPGKVPRHVNKVVGWRTALLFQLRLNGVYYLSVLLRSVV